MANLAEFPEDPVVRTAQEIESALEKKRDKKAFRVALYNALKMVQNAHRESRRAESGVNARLARRRTEPLDDAAQSAFDVSYDTLLTTALEWQEGFSR